MAESDPIVVFLKEIGDKDPWGLAGIRTAVEIAHRFALTKDKVRHRLNTLHAQGLVQNLGVMQGETGKPIGWKAA